MKKLLLICALAFAFSSLSFAASASLSCKGPTTGATPTSFNFYRGVVTGGPYSLVAASPTCSLTDSTVVDGSTYFYVATAVVGTPTCPAGTVCESVTSNEAKAVVPAAVNPVPNAPTGLTVNKVTATNIQLEWQDPAAQPQIATRGFTVMRSGPTANLWLPRGFTQGTSFTDAGLLSNHSYSYRVVANDVIAGRSVMSPPSNVVTAVTLRGSPQPPPRFGVNDAPRTPR